MESLHKALSKPGADWQKIIRSVLTPKDRLKHGRDYKGSGTESDPFIFAEGIEYYDAFAKLCDQMGLDKERRRLVHTTEGRLLYAVPDRSGTIYYFLAQIEDLGPRLE